jgi:hypothetical protein
MDVPTLLSSSGLSFGVAYAVWEIQHRRERGEDAAAAEHARQVQSIHSLQAALEEMFIGTGTAHNERFSGVTAWDGQVIREIWQPDAPLNVDTDQQLSLASSRVLRFQAQVTDGQLRSIADNCLAASARALSDVDVKVARASMGVLGAELRHAHERAGELLRAPSAS